MDERKWFYFVLFMVGLYSFGFGQGRKYMGPDDPAGDPAMLRVGYMTGNRVFLFFRNTTELSHCCDLGYDVSKWPNNYNGTKMLDGVALLVGARVVVKNDSVPVEAPEVLTGDLSDRDTLYYMQSNFRQHNDMDPTGSVRWGLHPVKGYSNELGDYPAMSNLPESWPVAGWPGREGTLKWPGEWNGRFGRGVMKADQECFFVVNDAQDQEYMEEDDTVKYYPRPGVHIGDKDPNVTVQKGDPWGGIGIRIEARSFQWANPQAQDVIFWEYNISNISDYDLPDVMFGYLCAIGIGGEEHAGGDDNAYFSQDLDMCYMWDVDGIARGGDQYPGTLGFAFLESAGIAYDNIDNDQDGLIDEKRDNQAQVKVGPYDGIAHLEAFLEHYHLDEEDLREHWDADEDQDWRDGSDLNGNGVYDNGEDPGDDVGLDGVSPYDINYTGPDEDGTECNHRPDYLEGFNSEPNFASTDVSESDMLGLTTFRFYLDWTNDKNAMRHDEQHFKFLLPGVFDEEYLVPENFRQQFASGLFPLYEGMTERVSMANLHSYEILENLNMPGSHKAPNLFKLKELTQVIYESDYRFAQPPLMPKLTAYAGDDKVYLSWDDKSDQLTRDPFVQNENDFEGYKIYKATDKKMTDAELITDAMGTPILKKPVFQCDLKDGIEGLADFGLINGLAYHLGDDSGIQHYFVDENVKNGRTYYYVLVAYDYGIPELGDGITPSENTYTLELDEHEDIRDISANVAIVTPCQKAAGYVPPRIKIDSASNLSTTTEFSFKIVNPEEVNPNQTYVLKLNYRHLDYWSSIPSFRHQGDDFFINDGVTVALLGADSIVYKEDTSKYVTDHLVYQNIFGNHPYARENQDQFDWILNTDRPLTTDPFDGIQLTLDKPVLAGQIDSASTGWVVGASAVSVEPSVWESKYFPYEYEIIFLNENEKDTCQLTTKARIKSPYSWEDDTEIGKDSLLLGQVFNFKARNKSIIDTNTMDYDKLELVVWDLNGDGEFDLFEDEVLAGHAVKSQGRCFWAGTVFSIHFRDVKSSKELPEAGDVYRLKFHRGFGSADSLVFTVRPETKSDEKLTRNEMDEIKVVPNPYVVTNLYEEAVANWEKSQRRRMMFTHLPNRCEIKLFTVSGVHIKTINVNNSIGGRTDKWDLNTEANGTAFWDLKTKEGLEVAAGYYIYHVKDLNHGFEKIGKLAVIK